VTLRRSSVFLEVFALSQSVHELLLTTMSDGPLTPEEYAVYSVVFEEESVTPTDMGRRLGMPKTTVMERVRMMEHRGHVRRVINPRDGRSYKLVLTAAGLAAHRQSHDRFEEAYRAFIRKLGGSERRAADRLAQIRSAVTAASGRKSDAAQGRRTRQPSP
jgi:DNA-binding MarR family transcriptional regulator